MTYSNHHSRIWIILAVFGAVLLIFVITEVLFIKFNGTNVPTPQIPRTPETYGSGPALSYVVLGDSTTVAQGGVYDTGIARSTARYLGQDHTVTFQNFGVSGARAADVATKQAPQAAKLHPDVVLVAVSANDVTHLTSLATVRRSLEQTVTTLRQANAAVIIVLTGSPQMGSVPRFPQPVKYFAKVRTEHMNTMIESLAGSEKITFAYLADKTGPTFLAHPELFAVDKFHPNDQGYQVWIPVLDNALSGAISK